MAMRTFKHLGWLAAVFAGLGFASCIRDDPDHCANRSGSATCTELGAGLFCSRCEAGNFGCVDQSPEGDCGVAEGGESSTTIATETQTDPTTDESSTGPPPACTAEGELDDTCPDATPYCSDGICVDCGDAGEEFCANLGGGATPACHPGWGRCVECTAEDENACGGESPFCGDDFTCGPCTRHSQCPASACDLEREECFPTNEVYFVDNSGACGTGTENNPFCTLQDALDLVGTGDRVVINLVESGTRYEERVVLTTNPDKTLALLGVGTPVLGGFTAQTAVLVSGAGMRLYLSGLQVERVSDERGLVSSQGGSLWLDECIITDNAEPAIELNGGDLHVRRSEIVANDGTGIDARNGSKIWMSSTIVAANGDDAQDTRGLKTDDSEFEIVYSTFAGNLSNVFFESDPSPTSLACTAGGGGPIRNSIFVNENLNSVNCPWAEFSDSAIDTEGFGDSNFILEEYLLEWWTNIGASNYRLRGNGGGTPFGDVAVHQLGDPLLDVDGNARAGIPGATDFAGADDP